MTRPLLTHLPCRLMMLAAWVSILAGQPVITPSTSPTVAVGSTYTFTADRAVTWSLTAGSKGSIDPATGVYTAPASIKPKSRFGPCQVVPNDSVWVTRIDGLAKHANSDSYMGMMLDWTLGWDFAHPRTNISNTTPTQEMHFEYTPEHDGTYRIPARFEAQGGYLADHMYDLDRHVYTVNVDDCSFQELYKLFDLGENPADPTSTAKSGYKYSLGWRKSAPGQGMTVAAGELAIPLILRLQDFRADEITHALAFTLANGFIDTNPVDTIWPGTGGSYVNFNQSYPPYGSRYRLKSTVDISGFSVNAQKVLLALKRYGAFIIDGGTSAEFLTDVDLNLDYDVAQALYEIRRSDLRFNTAFEVVDESALMDAANSHLVKLGAGVTPDDFVEVVADAGGGDIAKLRVVLQGVTIGTPEFGFTVMADGRIPLQTKVTGTANSTVNWAATGGTVSGDVYTPPSVTNPTTYVLTGTSAADANIQITLPVKVLPADTVVRVEAGGRSTAGATAPYVYVADAHGYTDPQGNRWFYDDSFWAGSLQAYGYGNYLSQNDDWYGGQPAGNTPLQYTWRVASLADKVGKLYVANGTYDVTLHFMNSATRIGANHTDGRFELNDATVGSVDASGTQFSVPTPASLTGSATVSDNLLKIAMRRQMLYGTSADYSNVPVSHFTITRTNPEPDPEPEVITHGISGYLGISGYVNVRP